MKWGSYFRCGKCSNDHDHAGSNNSQQTDDIHGANHVEDDKTWASQPLASERHSGRTPVAEERN
jgi:hypothetical protein